MLVNDGLGLLSDQSYKDLEKRNNGENYRNNYRELKFKQNKLSVTLTNDIENRLILLLIPIVYNT